MLTRRAVNAKTRVQTMKRPPKNGGRFVALDFFQSNGDFECGVHFVHCFIGDLAEERCETNFVHRAQVAKHDFRVAVQTTFARRKKSLIRINVVGFARRDGSHKHDRTTSVETSRRQNQSGPCSTLLRTFNWVEARPNHIAAPKF